MNDDYKSAGVDVEAGYRAVKLMKTHVEKTFRKEVMTDLGGFSGLFSIARTDISEPILVAGTDGVGTKLKIAFEMDIHDTIGIDCVAMCVNDIVCCGAEPLFFLDYLALSKNHPEKVANIVKGVADGCVQAGCALIGGETAEMPGFYPENEYDLAGFSVGIVSKQKIINGSTITPHDQLIGIASSGLHSNGYSLVRKIFHPLPQYLKRYSNELSLTIGEELLKPTKIYVKTLLSVIRNHNIKGICHITGGGFIENIPRVIPPHLGISISECNWTIPPIFELLYQQGNLDRLHMYNTFNMGIGMVLVVEKNDTESVLNEIRELGEQAFVIGEVTTEEGVNICLK